MRFVMLFVMQEVEGRAEEICNVICNVICNAGGRRKMRRYRISYSSLSKRRKKNS